MYVKNESCRECSGAEKEAEMIEVPDIDEETSESKLNDSIKEHFEQGESLRCNGDVLCKMLGYKIVYRTLEFEEAATDILNSFNRILCRILSNGTIEQLFCALKKLDDIMEQMCCLQGHLAKAIQDGLVAADCIEEE
jgi:hypothetical protein